jgi:hypothetical protein
MPAAVDPQDPRVVAIAAMHDPELPLAWGRMYAHQRALERVRRHLADAGRESKLGADWTPRSPAWRDAEVDAVARITAETARVLDDAAWFRPAWQQATAEALDSDEVDAVLARLRMPSGAPLAATMDWFVAELVMTRLTFTDRVSAGMPGNETVRAAVERTAQVKSERMTWDWSSEPQAHLFIYTGAGRKYFRDVSFRIVTLLNARLDAAAAAVDPAFEAVVPRLDAVIERAIAQARAAR